MPDAITPVRYAKACAPAHQRVLHGSLPFEETLVRLKEALQAEDVWLIHEIDPQMLLKRGGYAIQAVRQLLFFHPRYLVRILGINPGAIVEAPQKIVVMETAEGGVTLRFSDPASAFAPYPGLEALALELADLLERLAEQGAALRS